jgi:hypothetical protein
VVLVFLCLLVFSDDCFGANVPNKASYAENELSFISALESKYPRTNGYYVIHPEGDDIGWISNYYRALCSQMITYSLDKRGHDLSIDRNDPLFQTFFQYASADFQKLVQDTSHVAPAPLTACMIAMNLAQDELDADYHSEIQNLLSITTSFIKSRFDWNGSDDSKYYYTVPFFKALQVKDAGNTQAEEVGIAFSLYAYAAKLIPASITGGLEINQQWLKRAQELVDYSYTQCAMECPFSPNRLAPWLAANHNMDPSPVYTQSLLTSYGELAALYNQVESESSFPENFYADTGVPESTEKLKGAVGNIASALSTYTTKNDQNKSTFHFTGLYNRIRADGFVFATENYDLMRYTLRPDTNPLINSSIPVLKVDSVNEFIMPGTSIFKKYVINGDMIWHYLCDDSYCQAMNQQKYVDIWPQLDNRSAWLVPPPASHIDSLTQYFLPNGQTLNSFIYSGDHVWKYSCTIINGVNSGCRAEYDKSLADTWVGITNKDGAGWTTNPPPTDKVDSINQWLMPDNITLKVYVFRDDRAWHFTCTFNGSLAAGCQALNTKTLLEYWQGVPDFTEWDLTPPSDRIDSFSQSFNADKTVLTSKIFSGNHVWEYVCTFNGNSNTGCHTSGDKLLGQYWVDQKIYYQNRWPYPLQSENQYTGTADWGFDGAIQNSAYAALAVISPDSLSDRYTQLHEELMRRGLNNHPYFPAYLLNGQWTQDKYSGPPFYSYFNALTDGYGVPLSLEKRIAAHHWANYLGGYNTSFAYLAMTDKLLLKPFFSQPVITVTPQAVLVSWFNNYYTSMSGIEFVNWRSQWE